MGQRQRVSVRKGEGTITLDGGVSAGAHKRHSDSSSKQCF